MFLPVKPQVASAIVTKNCSLCKFLLIFLNQDRMNIDCSQKIGDLPLLKCAFKLFDADFFADTKVLDLDILVHPIM